MGNWQGAFEMYKRYYDHSIKMANFEKKSVLVEAELRHEIEKRSRETELLSRQKKELEAFNKQIEQRNRELNQFAFAASHDFKEPLRMITNYLQLLEKTIPKPTQEQKDYISYAVGGAKRILSLIDAMLEMSQINSEGEHISIDLNAIADEAYHSLKSRNHLPRSLTIVKGKLPVLTGRRSHFYLLFHHIMQNALQYNSTDEPLLHIKCKSNNKRHLITFADNGSGIAKQYREKVFDIFSRLDRSTDYSSVGIGLTLCKKIVETMHGEIALQDSELGGISVAVTLPVSE
jgi:light-regulated signal transduction histidine kinase (bacteriophytochrome)